MGSTEEAALLLAGQNILLKLGKAATYTPSVGDPVSCTVHYENELTVTPGSFDIQAHGPLETIEGLLSELGREPDKGDQFTIGSDTYTVQTVLDNDGMFVLLAVK
ncbi:MAG: head-tail joining protein [Planctomycetota bacterium]|jgi:hypothetical protein